MTVATNANAERQHSVRLGKRNHVAAAFRSSQPASPVRVRRARNVLSGKLLVSVQTYGWQRRVIPPRRVALVVAINSAISNGADTGGLDSAVPQPTSLQLDLLLGFQLELACCQRGIARLGTLDFYQITDVSPGSHGKRGLQLDHCPELIC